MNNNRLFLQLLLASVVCIGIALFIGSEIPGEYLVFKSDIANQSDTASLPRMALITSAVKSTPKIQYFEYTGGFENPFKSYRPR